MIELVLLGDPVAHSRSPAIHTAALAAAGLDGRYTVRRVDAEGLRAAGIEVRGGFLDGANITMPHKELAAELADFVTGEALRTGSANTWLRRGEELVGASTDGAGVLYAFEHAGIDPEARPRILGAGGAAAAAIVALEARRPILSARRLEAAHELVNRVGVDAEIRPWGSALAGVVLVNATPLGMAAEILPEAMLDGIAGLVDMPYGSAPTPAIRYARSAALPAADGLTMLVGQAAASFRLWTGLEPDMAVMVEAAKALKPLS